MKRFLLPVIGVAALVMSQASIAQWSYQTDIDKMTSKKTVEASLTSDRGMTLRFPYQGQNYAGLSVRKREGGPVEALFLVEKGQIMCGVRSCTIRIRFDDGEPMTFSGRKPSDHSSTAIFLDNPARFVTAAKTAKRRILVEVDMFQNGTQVLEFSAPQALAWR